MLAVAVVGFRRVERLAVVIEKLHKAADAVYASAKRKSLFQPAEKTYGNFLVEDEGVN